MKEDLKINEMIETTGAQTPLFDFGFTVDQAVSAGMCRYNNQDETVMCADAGFFAVSDGIGGLKHNGGGETSLLIKTEMPGRMKDLTGRWREKTAAERAEMSPQAYAAELLRKEIGQFSDFIYTGKNCRHRDIHGNGSFRYGATLSGVWLTGRYAIFINLGDSRGYLLPKGDENIIRITTDHNVAAELVQAGMLTLEEARYHDKAHRITRFMGMAAPAQPEAFIKEVSDGDRILLCTDGLHSMVDDSELPVILRSSENPGEVCERLVKKANEEGGLDNIAVVYLKIQDLKQQT